jgi:hypothetical protein
MNNVFSFYMRVLHVYSPNACFYRASFSLFFNVIYAMVSQDDRY